VYEEFYEIMKNIKIKYYYYNKNKLLYYYFRNKKYESDTDKIEEVFLVIGGNYRKRIFIMLTSLYVVCRNKSIKSVYIDVFIRKIISLEDKCKILKLLVTKIKEGLLKMEIIYNRNINASITYDSNCNRKLSYSPNILKILLKYFINSDLKYVFIIIERVGYGKI